jgi:hypothetical protein
MEKAKATMSSEITEAEGAGKEEDGALREVQSRIKQREGTEQKLEQKIGKEENMVKGAEPEKTQDEKNHQTLVQKQREAEKQKADLMALFMECKRSGSVISPRYEALLLPSAAAKAKLSWAGAWRGGLAKGDNPTNAAKDLENANALVEKYKEDFEKANSKLTKLENEHTQLKREREEQDMELKRLECTGAELDVVKEKAAAAEAKTLQKIDNEAKLNNCITSLEGQLVQSKETCTHQQHALEKALQVFFGVVLTQLTWIKGQVHEAEQELACVRRVYEDWHSNGAWKESWIKELESTRKIEERTMTNVTNMLHVTMERDSLEEKLRVTQQNCRVSEGSLMSSRQATARAVNLPFMQEWIDEQEMYRDSTEAEPLEAIDPALAGVVFNQQWSNGKVREKVEGKDSIPMQLEFTSGVRPFREPNWQDKVKNMLAEHVTCVTGASVNGMGFLPFEQACQQFPFALTAPAPPAPNPFVSPPTSSRPNAPLARNLPSARSSDFSPGHSWICESERNENERLPYVEELFPNALGSSSKV